LQKLTDKMNDLRYARERATDVSQVRKLTAEIKNVQEEMNDLTGIGGGGKDKGILASLFGIGSGANIGRQVFQGLIAGFGLGSALSIIPSLVASLTKYVETQLDAVAAAQALTQANDALGSSFSKISDEIRTLNQLEDDLLQQYIKETTGIDVNTFAIHRHRGFMPTLIGRVIFVQSATRCRVFIIGRLITDTLNYLAPVCSTLTEIK